MSADLKLATNNFRRPIIKRSDVAPATLAEKVSPAPSNNKPRVDDVARAAATASPKTTVTSPGGRYGHRPPVATPKSRYVKSHLQVTPASDVSNEDKFIIVIRPEAPRVFNVVPQDLSPIQIDHREHPDPADSDIDSEAGTDNDEAGRSDVDSEADLPHAWPDEDPQPGQGDYQAEPKSVARQLRFDSVSLAQSLPSTPAVRNVVVSAEPPAPPALELPAVPAFAADSKLLIPQGVWLRGMVDHLFESLSDPAVPWKLEDQAPAQVAPSEDIDKALIRTINAKVRSMSHAELLVAEAGLPTLDCYNTGNFTAENRLKFERTQQINLLVNDAIRKQLREHLKEEKAAKAAAVAAAPAAAAAAVEAATLERRGPLMRLSNGPEGSATPGPSGLERAARGVARGVLRTAKGVKALAGAPGRAAARISDKNAEVRELRQARRTARVQSMFARAQRNVDTNVRALAAPLGLTRKVGRDGKSRPRRPAVDVRFGWLTHSVPRPHSGGQLAKIYFGQWFKRSLEKHEGYANAFRGHVSRTLVRMETPDLVAVLANLDRVSDKNKSDFHFAILKAAVENQLTFRGYGITVETRAIVEEALDRLAAAPQEDTQTLARDRCVELFKNVTAIAIKERLPAETWNALILDALAHYAGQPLYREAVAALISEIPDSRLKELLDSNKVRGAKSAGHKLIEGLAVQRRVVDSNPMAACIGSIQSVLGMLAGQRPNQELLVSTLGYIGQAYQQILATGIELDTSREFEKLFIQLHGALASARSKLFADMTPGQLRTVAGFFQAAGLKEPNVAFIDAIDKKLKVGPFVAATRALHPTVRPRRPEDIAQAIHLLGKTHGEMRAMGLQVSHHDGRDPIPQHANLAMREVRASIPTLDTGLFEEMGDDALRQVEAAFVELNLDPGEAIGEVIKTRLHPVAALPMAAGRSAHLRELSEAPFEAANRAVAAPPVAIPREVVSLTNVMLAKVVNVADSSGQQSPARRINFLYSELLDEIVASGLARNEEEAVRFVSNSLALVAATRTGSDTVGVLLKHLPPAQLREMTAGAVAQRTPAQPLEAFQRLVATTTPIRVQAASASFDKAVQAFSTAAEVEPKLELLQKANALRAELVQWEMPAQPVTLATLAGAQQAFIRALSEDHEAWWNEAIAGFQAGNVAAGAQAVIEAMNVAHKIESAGADSSVRPDFTEALAKMCAKLKPTAADAFRDMLDHPMLRELIQAMEESASPRRAADLAPGRGAQLAKFAVALKNLRIRMEPMPTVSFRPPPVVSEAVREALKGALDASDNTVKRPAAVPPAATPEELAMRAFEDRSAQVLELVKSNAATVEVAAALPGLLQAYAEQMKSGIPPRNVQIEDLRKALAGREDVIRTLSVEQVTQLRDMEVVDEGTVRQARLAQFDAVVRTLKIPLTSRLQNIPVDPELAAFNETQLRKILELHSALRAEAIRPSGETIAVLEQRVARIDVRGFEPHELAELLTMCPAVKKKVANAIDHGLNMSRTKHRSQWEAVMGQFQEGRLIDGIREGGEAIRLGNEVVALRQVEAGREISGVSLEARRGYLANMGLNIAQQKTFAQVLGRPDVREAIAYLKEVTNEKLAKSNPKLFAELSTFLADLDTIRKELEPTPEPFASITISPRVQGLMMSVIALPGLRGDRAYTPLLPLPPR